MVIKAVCFSISQELWCVRCTVICCISFPISNALGPFLLLSRLSAHTGIFKGKTIFGNLYVRSGETCASAASLITWPHVPSSPSEDVFERLQMNNGRGIVSKCEALRASDEHFGHVCDTALLTLLLLSTENKFSHNTWLLASFIMRSTLFFGMAVEKEVIGTFDDNNSKLRRKDEYKMKLHDAGHYFFHLETIIYCCS